MRQNCRVSCALCAREFFSTYRKAPIKIRLCDVRTEGQNCTVFPSSCNSCISYVRDSEDTVCSRRTTCQRRDERGSLDIILRPSDSRGARTLTGTLDCNSRTSELQSWIRWTVVMTRARGERCREISVRAALFFRVIRRDTTENRTNVPR